MKDKINGLTVRELIEKLNQIEDKNLIVGHLVEKNQAGPSVVLGYNEILEQSADHFDFESKQYTKIKYVKII